MKKIVSYLLLASCLMQNTALAIVKRSPSIQETVPTTSSAHLETTPEGFKRLYLSDSYWRRIEEDQRPTTVWINGREYRSHGGAHGGMLRPVDTRPLWDRIRGTRTIPKVTIKTSLKGTNSQELHIKTTTKQPDSVIINEAEYTRVSKNSKK